MKFSDYKRLGKISIKSRKKSTKNTVRGISFGLILIVSVVFLAFAVFMSFNSEINKIRTLASFTLESKNIYDSSGSDSAVIDEDGGYIRERAVPSYEVIERIKASDACEESLTSSYLSFSSSYSGGSSNSLMYSIDGSDPAEYGPSNSGNNSDSRGNGSSNSYSEPALALKICNLEASGGKIILDSEIEDLNGKPAFLAGGGFSAETGGKTEVILSYNAAEYVSNGAFITSMIGKKLTLYTYGGMDYSTYLDDDNNPDNPYSPPENNYGNAYYSNTLMTDFVIKGVLSKDFFGLMTRENEAQIWISDKSFYYDDGDGGATSLLPEMRVQTLEENDYTRNITICTYKDEQPKLMKFASDNGIVFPFLAGLTLNLQNYYSYNSDNAPTLKASTVLQGKSFADAVDLTSVIDAELTPLYAGADSSYISNAYQSFAYMMFKTLFTALQVVVLVLFIFGGVLFVTSMLNLYNSINYSVQARRNYLGMMRAIGAKNSSIPKMYFVEMVLIFMKTLVWVLIFSFGICFGLRALVGMLMKQAGGMLMGMNLSLNLLFYPISLVMVYGITFIIALFFALASCGPVSRKPILDVLRTDI